MNTMSTLKRTGLLVVALAIIGASFGFGTYVGYHERPAIEQVTELYNKETGKPDQVDFAEFWEAWSILKSKYAGDASFESQTMVYGAIAGMVEALGDPYTVFFPPKEKEQFESEVKGRFEGIGAEIGMRKDVLTIIAPLKDSPAEKIGIKAGDRLLKIDDKIATDLTVEEAVTLIRGEHGTKVKLTILRNSESDTREFEIVRDVIRIPVLETEKRPGGIFIIKLYNFSENSPFEFRKAVREMKDSSSTKLIIDLRNNPGGYLEASVDIASWFLKEGEVVVREDFGQGREETHKSKGYDVFTGTPIVILLNEGSASASEILAGALKDNLHVKIVGKKSFGKGSVQELVNITDKTSLKVTIARWLTPSGKSISKEGIDPDVQVEYTKADFETGKDPQMDKAVELITGL